MYVYIASEEEEQVNSIYGGLYQFGLMNLLTCFSFILYFCTYVAGLGYIHGQKETGYLFMCDDSLLLFYQ